MLANQGKEQVVTTQNSQLVELLEHVLAHDEEGLHTQLKQKLPAIKKSLKQKRKGEDEVSLQRDHLIRLQLAMLVQAFQFPEETEEALEDLAQIMSRHVPVVDKPKKKVKKEKVEEEQPYVPVLVDLLISQLTKSHGTNH